MRWGAELEDEEIGNEKPGYKDIINLGSLEDAAKTLKRKIVN